MTAGRAAQAHRRRFIACCAWVMTGMPTWARVEPPVAEVMLRQCGVWQQLGEVAAQVRHGMLLSAGGKGRAPSDSEARRISRAVDAAYSANKLRSAFLAAFAADLDPAHVPALRRWYEGALGSGIVRAELVHAREQPEAVVQRGSELLRAMPASRRRLLQELILATRAAEMQTEIAIGTTLAMQLAATSMAAPSHRASVREMQQALYARRHQLMRTFGALALAAFAATYASLDDRALETYLAFLKSGPGQHHVEVLARATSAAMLDAADALGSSLGATRDKANT